MYALGWALCAPVFITIKSYCIRCYAGDYKSFDMGIDALILEKLCYCLVYIGYVKTHEFRLDQFIWGAITGVLYMIGKQLGCIAYSEGPGGPINTLLMTQSLY